ncbi:hypothetical protein L0244_09505 [bacterium]|nr:hypothetical protein [bacterium]
MEIKPKIQSVDVSKISQKTSNEQSSVSSAPARVNLGVGKTHDSLEQPKASLLDSMLIPTQPSINAIQAAIPAAMQEVIEFGSKGKQKEDPGFIFKGPMIGTLIGEAIGNHANDDDEAAKKSGEKQRQTNTIKSKSDRD